MKRLMGLCVILLISLLYPAYGKDCKQWIKAKLDSMSAPYTITGTGDFRVEFPVEFSGDGRTQFLFIDPDSKDFFTEDVLVIWSPVYSCNGPVSAEIANKLLKDNAEQLVGFWNVITNTEGVSYVIFKRVYDVETIKEMFSLYIFNIASTADDMEKKLTGEDKY